MERIVEEKGRSGFTERLDSWNDRDHLLEKRIVNLFRIVGYILNGTKRMEPIISGE